MYKLSPLWIPLLFSFELIRAVENVSSEITSPDLECVYKRQNENKEILVAFMMEIWNKGNLDKTEAFVTFPYVIHGVML